jgi:hypothetical protein
MWGGRSLGSSLFCLLLFDILVVENTKHLASGITKLSENYNYFIVFAEFYRNIT